MSTHLPVLDSFERPDVCTPCGGQCCRRMPGAAFPHDFGADEASILSALTEALQSGRWAIDWWEGDPRDGITYDDPDYRSLGYFVRPATVGNEGDILDASWGGACTFHLGHGCAIFERRPSGCRGLKPSDPPGACVAMHSTKHDAAIAWLPFHALIQEARERARRAA